MSFQLRISRDAEQQGINVSLPRQFFAPLFLLVFVIMGASFFLDSGGSSRQVASTDGSVSASKINHLQLQVATLEGESQRLKEFAKKMVRLAKLDTDVFNFDKPPARGGLGGRNIFQRYTSALTVSMAGDLDGLKKQFLERSNQLERMQLILKSRILGESEKKSRWPVATAYISSTFGMRKDPFTGSLRMHRGLDLAGPRGSDIMSVAAGKVVFTGRKGGYGRVIEVQHADGLKSRYAHLEASLVKKGQTVELGEKIARLGTSGRSTGPHLHLEILRNNKNINPMVFLGRRK